MDPLHPKLIPLLRDLSELNIRNYLTSTEFERLMIKNGFETTWHDVVHQVKLSRTYYSMMTDHKSFDSEKAFNGILGFWYDNDRNQFNKFLFVVLDGFIGYEQINSLRFSSVAEDLNLIEFPAESLKLLTSKAGIMLEKPKPEKFGKKLPKNTDKTDIQSIQVFISHSHNDKNIIDPFVQKVLRLGVGMHKEQILCTSIEAMGIVTGNDFRSAIKSHMEKARVVLLFLSKYYKESEICLNEMGAAWALDKIVLPVILPSLSYPRVGVLHITNHIARIDTGAGIDALIHDLRKYLEIEEPLDLRDFNKHRDEFLKNLSAVINGS